jgi:nucleotide-binding universal stress UspA family protein
MFKKILVPLDGSQMSEAALPCAEKLGNKLNARVSLLQVLARAYYHYPDGEVGAALMPYSDEEMLRLRADAEDYLKKVCGQLADKGVSADYLITIGMAAEEIARVADETGIDLVAMSTHGRSGVSRWAIGSTAYKVVRILKEPVILIRARYAQPGVQSQKILSKVLVTLDGSRESEKVITYIEELATRLQMELVLLRVVDIPLHHVALRQGAGFQDTRKIESAAELYLRRVAKGLESKGITVKTVTKVGDTAEEIVEFAKTVKADLVAMTTHGRSGISRWYFGSVAEKVLHGGDTPLLLVRLER